jgi:hypothetical protein
METAASPAPRTEHCEPSRLAAERAAYCNRCCNSIPTYVPHPHHQNSIYIETEQVHDATQLPKPGPMRGRKVWAVWRFDHSLALASLSGARSCRNGHRWFRSFGEGRITLPATASHGVQCRKSKVRLRFSGGEITCFPQQNRATIKRHGGALDVLFKAGNCKSHSVEPVGGVATP